jgi:hypothetical protein
MKRLKLFSSLFVSIFILRHTNAGEEFRLMEIREGHLLSPPTEAMAIFDYHLRLISARTYDDKFSSNERGWLQTINSKGYGFWDEFNNAGQKTVVKILTYSARETVATLFDYNYTFNRIGNNILESAADLFVQLIHGSVGNTAKEGVSALSTVYNPNEEVYLPLENSNHFDPGLHLSSKSVSLFLRRGIGHNNDQPLWVSEVIAKYSSVGDLEFGKIFRVPLMYKWDVRVGLLGKPVLHDQTDSNRWEASCSLNRSIGKWPAFGSFNFGVSLHEYGKSVNLSFFNNF